MLGDDRSSAGPAFRSAVAWGVHVFCQQYKRRKCEYFHNNSGARMNDDCDLPTLFSDEEFANVHQQLHTCESSSNELEKAHVHQHAPGDGLPESTIEQRFPHIARQLVAMWGSEACAMLISRLVVSDRLDRKGFPREVIDDLMMLYELNDRGVGPTLLRTPPFSRQSLNRNSIENRSNR